MICRISAEDVPGIKQPQRRMRPEGDFAKRQMQEFLDSGFDVAEVTGIPAAYNTTRLYEALNNAAYTLTAKPGAVRVMRRGGRLFLWREQAWKTKPYERRWPNVR